MAADVNPATGVATRPFATDDAHAMSRIHFAAENAALDEWGAGVHMEGDVEDAVKGWLQPMPEGTRIFVAEVDDAVVGWLFITVTAHTGYLGGLYVDPAYWTRGIGSTLMNLADEEFARAVDRATLWVMSRHARARRFYERRGWSVLRGVTQSVTLQGVECEQTAYVKEFGLIGVEHKAE